MRSSRPCSLPPASGVVSGWAVRGSRRLRTAGSELASAAESPAYRAVPVLHAEGPVHGEAGVDLAQGVEDLGAPGPPRAVAEGIDAEGAEVSLARQRMAGPVERSLELLVFRPRPRSRFPLSSLFPAPDPARK